MAWAEERRCTHGMTFAETCDYCEIVGLEESLTWMTRSVKRDEKRLAELKEKVNPTEEPACGHKGWLGQCPDCLPF